MKRVHARDLQIVFVLSACLLSASCAQKERSVSADDEIYVAAYVWPSCHFEERNAEMLWPEGTGEWEIIRKGTPRFDGHYQPKVPLWGYEMDDDPKVMEKWIDVATSHGVNVFIFDWYWFGEGPFLESSLNNGFLKAGNNGKMKFYVMWANHDVKMNYWNHYKYDSDSLLWTGSVDQENYRIIVDRLISQYFHQSNYFKIDGKPVFSIFNINKFVQDCGSVDGAGEALDYFREAAIEAGFPGLHVQIIGFGGNESPYLLWDHVREGKTNPELASVLGINSVTKYNWGQGEGIEDYIQWGEEAMERRKNWEKALDIPYFPNVSIGWDDTPRFPHKGKEHVIHYNNSPESFAAYLQKAKEYVEDHPDQVRLITLFSWNEWVEGGYLLPDMRWNYGYLQAVEKVMSAN